MHIKEYICGESQRIYVNTKDTRRFYKPDNKDYERDHD